MEINWKLIWKLEINDIIDSVYHSKFSLWLIKFRSDTDTSRIRHPFWLADSLQ